MSDYKYVILYPYFLQGGIKAVVWTDFFQGFIMFGVFIVVFILVCMGILTILVKLCLDNYITN